MIVVMMTFGTIILAQCITDRVVGRGYGMNQSLFHKSLQRAVNSYTVELFTGLFLYVGMRKGAICV